MASGGDAPAGPTLVVDTTALRNKLVNLREAAEHLQARTSPPPASPGELFPTPAASAALGISSGAAPRQRRLSSCPHALAPARQRPLSTVRVDDPSGVGRLLSVVLQSHIDEDEPPLGEMHGHVGDMDILLGE